MTRFEVTGRLQLWEQDGGFADDAFELLRLDNDSSLGMVSLADAVAEHFGAERNRDGNRDIGRVRITIERVDGAPS